MTSGGKTEIDRVLRGAVEAREVPGVVALAASDRGMIFEGAFGVRDLDAGGAMGLDTVFRIASMTKAITSVAAMQLVEQGRLGLNDPVPTIDPALNAPLVLDGFDAAGQPRLRPAKRPITLRHLLTHTAGFTYDWSNPNTLRYAEATGMPPMPSGKRAALCQPLAFDPAETWEYGINIDWVGRIIETVSVSRWMPICASMFAARWACATPVSSRQRSSTPGWQLCISARPTVRSCRRVSNSRLIPNFTAAAVRSIRPGATT